MMRPILRAVRAAAVHAILAALSLTMLVPLGWMISTSLKETGAILSRDIEWLPWQDWLTVDSSKRPVLTLNARVRNIETHEQIEVGIRSLNAFTKRTLVSLPDSRFEGEVEALRVRLISNVESTEAAFWTPFESVRRTITPRWSNYVEALHAMQFGKLLANTFAVAYLGTLGNLLSCSIVAYGFARFRFPGRDSLFLVMLSTMMLPPVVTMIPVYLLFRGLHWIDTLLPLFAPAWLASNTFAVFLFRQYFMTLPFDFDDAARIDGCGPLSIYWRVLLPQTKPVLATVGMLCFTSYWLDFMTPLIYLNSDTKATLSLGLYIFKGAHTTDWHYLMAATLAVSAPCMALFFFGQRYFVEGVVLSGVKA